MNRMKLIELFNKEQRREVDYPGFRREEAGAVIRSVSLSGRDHMVIYSDLEDADADAAIEEQLHYFRRLGQPFEWKLYDFDRPADLLERLAAKGFRPGDAEALLVLPLHEGEALLRFAIPPTVRRVTDEAGIDDIVELENGIWGEPHDELGERLKEELSDSDRLAVFAVYEEGRMASAAWMYLHPGTSFCSLWGGSTLSEFRGRGHYRALIAARAQHAWKNGFRMLMVDASPMSRPILERQGFVFLGYSYPCMSPDSRE